VADLLPFRGLRYAAGGDLSAVTAPPYDVIDEDEHALLERSHEQNAVRLILPRDGHERDRYEVAAATLATWRRDGVLALDEQPAFYAYRMSYIDPDGEARSTTGVIGALALPPEPGAGDVLPHERTLPKARSDRLAILRATRANLDPIWVLSLATGLTDAIGEFVPLITASDETGTRHELAPITDPGVLAALGGLVASAPVVVADGHHRFETACAYRDEHADAGAGAIMALTVELTEPQLCVRPIHRLVAGLDDPASLRDGIGATFRVEGAGANTPDGVHDLLARMASEDALGLVDRAGLALLRPRGDVLDPRLAELPAALHDVDAARFDVGILPVLGDATLGYRDNAVTIAALVDKHAIDAGIFLRPVSVEQIRAAAFDGVRMPEKTTFFHPKPRTGMVFRDLDA